MRNDIDLERKANSFGGGPEYKDVKWYFRVVDKSRQLANYTGFFARFHWLLSLL